MMTLCIVYRSVFLTKNRGRGRCDSLILLYRTLCERPELGSHVKHIACLISLREDNPWPGESVFMLGHQLRLHNSWEYYRPRGTMSHYNPHRIGECCFGHVLLASPNLESLVLQLPRRFLPSQENRHFLSRDMGLGNDPQYDTLNRILDDAMDRSPKVLRSLRILKLQSDVDSSPWSGFTVEQAGMRRDQTTLDAIEVQWDACPALFDAPNLSEFEVFGHSLRGLTTPGQVKVLSISGYYRSSTARLFLLHSSGVITAPAILEKLTLHPFPEYYGATTVSSNRQRDIDKVEATEMAWSLGMYEYFIWLSRETLRSLDLQTMGRWSALAGCWKYDHNKRLHGIRCLPEMHKLEDLTIELGALIGSPDRCGRTKLGNILPPNLEALVLIERWRSTCYHRSCQADCHVSHGTLQYARSFLKMLNRFARHQPSALPRLRKVTLVCNRAWKLYSLADTPRCFNEAETAVLLALKGAGWHGRDTYHKNEIYSSGREDFASASRIFTKNGVAFDIGLLERGKYYIFNPSGSYNDQSTHRHCREESLRRCGDFSDLQYGVRDVQEIESGAYA